MTKIQFDPGQQQIEVTRKIGKTGDGQVTVNSESAEIKINLGVGSIGVTTDYGGAISLGIAGQEVTWGTEGGTIHLGVGGFEVDVEAKDCIVTETKSIFGQVVAQRSYPDPGCKLPTPTPPPSFPKQPIPEGSGPIIPSGLDSTNSVLVVCDAIGTNSLNNDYVIMSQVATTETKTEITGVVDFRYFTGFTIKSTSEATMSATKLAASFVSSQTKLITQTTNMI